MSSTPQEQAEKSWPDYEEKRICMTVGCRDADSIPKVAGAGQVFEREGQRLQLMHEGTLVKAGGYYGPWMTEIIRRLEGHHEPQEELLFHHLLRHCRPGSRMMEVGAFWAYYACWFLRAVSGASVICMEPDSSNAECGRQNLRLNSLEAKWIRGFAGRHYLPCEPFRQESDQQLVEIPCHNFSSLLEEAGPGLVELLHIDAQGAELPFLESLGDNDLYRQVRFVVVSTHHESISGSPKTHEECLKVIQRIGGCILEEHSVEESFSGDGLIVASFDPCDRNLKLPTISRNSVRKSLFGFPPPPGGEVNLVATENGPMLVRKADLAIGSMLALHGRFEEDTLIDVTRFLCEKHGFTPKQFVDIGANIGTHILRALRGGYFTSGVAVEMDPDNFRLLECNVRLNLVDPSVQLVNTAVGERIGVAKMERSPDNLGDHRIQGAPSIRQDMYGEKNRVSANVPMTTLDQMELDYHLKFDASTLLWIDTQGYEGHVLQGANQIMQRPEGDRPMIVLEFWPYGLDRVDGFSRLIQCLQEFGSLRNLRAKNWQTAPALQASDLIALREELLSDTATGGLLHADLLCVP